MTLEEYLAKHQAQLDESARLTQAYYVQRQTATFLELVETEIQEAKCSYIEAVYKVASEHPELYRNYRAGTSNRSI